MHYHFEFSSITSGHSAQHCHCEFCTSGRGALHCHCEFCINSGHGATNCRLFTEKTPNFKTVKMNTSTNLLHDTRRKTHIYSFCLNLIYIFSYRFNDWFRALFLYHLVLNINIVCI